MADADWPAKFTLDQFWDFTEPLEGGIQADCMYMVKDLQVATAMGITFTGKANPNTGLQMAKSLDWVYKKGHPQAGKPCAPEDIEADYNEVLKRDDIGRLGSGYLDKWKAITNCRITEQGLKKGVRSRVVGNINYVRTNRTKDLGNFDDFPADAQLCVISLTWASGNAFNYPNFAKACREANWFEAAKQCGFSNKEGTIIKRQKAQEEMMRNAGCVKLGIGDPNTLHWPRVLPIPDLTWLKGWWTVRDESYYYYYFDGAGGVVYIETKPTTSGAPSSPKNRGTYAFDSANRLVVQWNAVAGLGPTIETFWNARPGVTQMNANSNLYSPLIATRIG